MASLGVSLALSFARQEGRRGRGAEEAKWAKPGMQWGRTSRNVGLGVHVQSVQATLTIIPIPRPHLQTARDKDAPPGPHQGPSLFFRARKSWMPRRCFQASPELVWGWDPMALPAKATASTHRRGRLQGAPALTSASPAPTLPSAHLAQCPPGDCSPQLWWPENEKDMKHP